MKDTTIQIGQLNLQDFEIPVSVRFGGRHRLAIHRLSTGKRVIERLGPDDGEISFQGTFSGPYAAARAREFDNFRLSGDVVWATWQSFRRLVIVKTFIAEYRSPWWIPYRVSCVIVEQAGVSEGGASTLSALIFADLGTAISLSAGQSLDFNALQVALSDQNAFNEGTSAQTSAIRAVDGSLSAIDAQIAEQSGLLATPAGMSLPPSLFSSSFGSTVDSAGALAAAVNIRSYIGRIGMNLDG